MHALIVVAHHDPHSLTHSIARQIGEGLLVDDSSNSVEIADLSTEGFEPRFGTTDWAVYHREEKPPADVLAEQTRIERADELVLVYPVYWWSMPALLKGWIDRVFSNGWAFNFKADTPFERKLGHLRVHLVAVGGGDAGSFSRHGYDKAMKTQIDEGIFKYCGATVVTSQLLLDSESADPQIHLDTARQLGRSLFEFS